MGVRAKNKYKKRATRTNNKMTINFGLDLKKRGGIS